MMTEIADPANGAVSWFEVAKQLTRRLPQNMSVTACSRALKATGASAVNAVDADEFDIGRSRFMNPEFTCMHQYQNQEFQWTMAANSAHD